MKKITTLEEALLIKLETLYSAETQLIKALAKMAEKATNPDLLKAFREHLDETREHVSRLEKAIAEFEKSPQGLKEEAARGLIADIGWIIAKDPEKEVFDAMLIASASYIEHYEIAGYLSALRWAEELGLEPIAGLLRETLREEEAAAEKLVSLAESLIDKEAT